jgi:hypothetical protein
MMSFHKKVIQVNVIKRSLTFGHVSTSTRPSATALPGSRVSWEEFLHVILLAG